jgi:hypothetical protein
MKLKLILGMSFALAISTQGSLAQNTVPTEDSLVASCLAVAGSDQASQDCTSFFDIYIQQLNSTDTLSVDDGIGNAAARFAGLGITDPLVCNDVADGILFASTQISENDPGRADRIAAIAEIVRACQGGLQTASTEPILASDN